MNLRRRSPERRHILRGARISGDHRDGRFGAGIEDEGLRDADNAQFCGAAVIGHNVSYRAKRLAIERYGEDLDLTCRAELMKDRGRLMAVRTPARAKEEDADL